ncbi:MAG: hypothetical protein FWD39_04015 [Clostridiales bacterium]|nr:hypothetical protein [Clostridiales bacterium]
MQKRGKVDLVAIACPADVWRKNISEPAPFGDTKQALRIKQNFFAKGGFFDLYKMNVFDIIIKLVC